MSTSEDTLVLRRKRLAFRASHRGIKEMDLLMGAFADKKLATLDEAGLDRFEALIDVPDKDLYDWVAGRSAVPDEFDNDIMAELKSFRFVPGDFGENR